MLGLVLGQRRRQWPNSNPALGRHIAPVAIHRHLTNNNNNNNIRTQLLET